MENHHKQQDVIKKNASQRRSNRLLPKLNESISKIEGKFIKLDTKKWKKLTKSYEYLVSNKIKEISASLSKKCIWYCFSYFTY